MALERDRFNITTRLRPNSDYTKIISYHYVIHEKLPQFPSPYSEKVIYYYSDHYKTSGGSIRLRRRPDGEYHKSHEEFLVAVIYGR